MDGEQSVSIDSNAEMSLLHVEDSRYALASSYEVLRDRYNKLKGQYRKLLRLKTCSQCQCLRSLALDSLVDKSVSMSIPNMSLSPENECTQLVRDIGSVNTRLECLTSNPNYNVSDMSSLHTALNSLRKFQQQISSVCSISTSPAVGSTDCQPMSVEGIAFDILLI